MRMVYKINNVAIASLRIKTVKNQIGFYVTSIETMSIVYKVIEIEGKGLGCVATVDIEKGSLNLTENPQICGNTEEGIWSSKWIKSLLKSFKQMKKADQLEYMALHNKWNNFQDSQIEMFKEKIMMAHCLYRFLDDEKLAASNLPLQAFEGFIGQGT